MREDRGGRRSLTNVGGRIQTSGDAEDARALARALDVESSLLARDAPEDPGRAHVHGFHAYPARMHPLTAARLVASFSAEGARVLDPFCGSGTVLVEAMLAGRTALGVDLNPLAVALSRLKTTRLTPDEAAALVAFATQIGDVADARRKAKAGATRRFPQEDMAAFDPHVLLELDTIRACLEGSVRGESALPKIPQAARHTLFLVLSAILTKVSRKKADTSEDAAPKRLAAGYPTRLFVKKTRELGERLVAFSALLPVDVKRPRIAVEDATKLEGVAENSIDAVVTSPPYAGTYDYLAHHSMRLRWLSMPMRELETSEIGARRDYAALDARAAEDRYANELAAMLEACARVTKLGAAVVLQIADSATNATALYADELVHDVARDHGAFRPAARASQLRSHFHGPSAHAFKERPRAEHLLLLRRL